MRVLKDLRFGRAAAAVTLTGMTAAIAGFLLVGGATDIVYCDGRLMTPSQVAAHRGISFEDLQGAQTRSLTVSEICTMAQAKLERAIYRARHPKPDHPGDWATLRARQQQDENGRIPMDGLVRAAEHVERMEAAQANFRPLQISRTSWRSLGPGNIGGRIRALVIHPTQPNTMFLGSVSGGIWKTTNGGTSWTVLSNFLANMAVSSLVMDRVNPNVMYAGTGEGFFNADAIQGAGIFKTTNGGATWTQLASTNNVNFRFVNRLAISPSNAIILAATNSGIFRSTNGGTSWTNVAGDRALDVDFHPTDSTRAIFGGDNGLAGYSTTGGSTWFAATGLPAAAARFELAFAPSNGNIVYASVDNLGGQIWKSTNRGQSYALVNTGKNFLGTQGWYDNAIWVDPVNANRLIVGGIDLWRSINGGTTLTKISRWDLSPTSAHADHHIIVSHPGYNGTTNQTTYFGNDGGIYRANALAVAQTTGWQELNNGLGITQFYSAAGNPNTGDIIGGAQDNGSLFSRIGTGPEAWRETFGGDGGWSAADPTNANVFYGEYVFLTLFRSTDRGVSGEDIWPGIGDANGCALFIAPFILDPNNANRLLAGGCRLWRSNNAKGITPTWASIKPTIGSEISAIAVAPGNSNIIWVGHANGNVYRTLNGTAATPAWTKVDGVTLPNRFVTRIAIGTDPNNVYVTFGGFSPNNVYRTTNGNAAAPTWVDRTGAGATGLPNVPVRSVVIHPANQNWIYVGTEVGVFASQNAGATWIVPHTGPSNTSVDELIFMNTALVAATHGRGIFKSETLACVTLTKTVSPAGFGTIAAGPGPNCVDTAGAYSQRTNVRLTATPAAGKVFVQWTGASTSTNPAITLNMNAAKSVTAVFANGPAPQEVSFSAE